METSYYGGMSGVTPHLLGGNEKIHEKFTPESQPRTENPESPRYGSPNHSNVILSAISSLIKLLFSSKVRFSLCTTIPWGNANFDSSYQNINVTSLRSELKISPTWSAL